ncbi:MAG: ABC transporter permease [Stellaceae bacterium]
MSAAVASGSDVRRVAVRRRPSALLLAAASIGPLLVLLPLGYTVFEATGAGRAEAIELLVRPLVGELLVNTVGLVVATTVATAIIGTGTAWLVERTDLPGRRVWAVLAAVPLAVPPFVSSYAWVSLSPAFQDFLGAWLVVTCSYYPLVYLPVAAALRGLDPALEETGRSLGQGGWSCFRRIVLPQLRPALFGGMLLVALNVLVEFGAFALLRFRTFTTELYAEYRTGFGGSGAALLAVILLVLCLVCLFAEVKVRGGADYARIGRGTRRRAARHALGRFRLPALLALIVLAVVTLCVPLGMILYWLTQHGAAAISPAEVSASLLIGATLSSLWLGLAGAALTVALALPLGFLAVRFDGRFVTMIERAAYLAQGVPGIVVALALISLTVRVVYPLYQTAALLLVAYAIVFLPLALVSVRAAVAQAQRNLEEAGRSLGLGWLAVIRRVLLPLIGPGLGAAAALVFVSIVTELTATLLLAPIGTQTLAIVVWADTSTLAFAAAAPYAALMMALSFLSTWLLARRFGATRFL